MMPAACPPLAILVTLAVYGLMRDIPFFMMLGPLGAGFILGAEWVLWLRGRRRP